MLLFCLAIEPILKYLDDHHIKFICYADDIVIEIDDQMDPYIIIEEMQKLYSSMGLTINPTKCQITSNGGVVEFMG